MKDQMTLAAVNLYAVLGAIPRLCELSPEAKSLVANDTVSIAFSIKNGAAATLFFDKGQVRMEKGTKGAQILIPFKSPEKFNGMIDGSVTPIPARGFTKIGFLLRRFSPLTDMLSRYLRATDEDLSDAEFYKRSTCLMLYVISEAMAAIGNHDTVGRFSASNIPDGVAKIAIADTDAAYVACDDHTLTARHGDGITHTASMTFRSLDVARALFDGKLNAVTAVGTGDVAISGMVPMLDNLNRILDRVAYYLA